MGGLRGALGTPPIHPLAFAVAKLAVAVSWGILLIEMVRGEPAFAPLRTAFAIPLIIAGAALMIAGAAHLGSALRVGLPRESTTLHRVGVYRITRNPIYLGVYLTVAGSALAVPTILNIVAAVTAIALHHAIVLAEERFLRERFGEEWADYQRRVPRYLWRS
ncbi:MAG: methyltransferase family protein [Thermoanaerobaculia bacterium]